jgi:hypothetical protein
MAEPVRVKSNYTEQRDAAIALSTELHKSSAQEYDKQTVYLAGGGLALTLTFAKDIIHITGSHAIPLLILTWIAFATALLCNLISQRKATEVYSLARRLNLYLRDCEQQGITCEESKRQQIDLALHQANKWLVGLNKASEWGIIVGISAFIVFGAINAYLAVAENATASSISVTNPANGQKVGRLF